MTRIRASCPDCREVDLAPSDVDLRVVRDTDGSVSEESCYSFVCPECEVLQIKPADERIVNLLTTGGVNIDEVAPKPAASHPEDPPDGPPFTHDDLLDFHLLLKRDDWFSLIA